MSEPLETRVFMGFAQACPPLPWGKRPQYKMALVGGCVSPAPAWAPGCFLQVAVTRRGSCDLRWFGEGGRRAQALPWQQRARPEHSSELCMGGRGAQSMRRLPCLITRFHPLCPRERSFGPLPLRFKEGHWNRQPLELPSI